jgi:hypothetical protein
MTDTVYAQLEKAKRSGDLASLGDAHMAIVESLVADYDIDSDRSIRDVALGSIQEHLDRAFDAFGELDDPLRNAYAWVTQAAASAEFAAVSQEPDERARHFYQAIDSSEKGLAEVYRFDSAGFDLMATACSQVLGVLARLRSLEMPEETQPAIDEMIGGVSELMGEALANDFRFRNEGIDRVHTARLMGLLADMEEDPAERLDALRVQFDLVMDAVETLRETSAKSDAEASLKWAREIKEQIEQLQAQRSSEPAKVLCRTCGHENVPGSKFCAQCGAQLGGETD